MRFQVVIFYDPEYKGYVVEVPQLAGCMSQGKTVDEALANIKDAIKGWLEVERATLSIPNHKELAPGLLRGLIRKSGLAVDEFLEAK